MFDNPRFAAVFRFYAAFTKLETEGIRDVVALIARGGERHCLNLMHCLYEADDISLCCFVVSQLETGLDLSVETFGLPFSGVLPVVYPLEHHWEFKVDLYYCSLDDYSVSFLTKGLSKSVCSAPGVEGSGLHDPPPGQFILNLHHNRIFGGGVRCLSEVISHHNIISELTLSGNKIREGEDGFKHLLQALRTNISVITLVQLGCSLRIDADSCPLLVEMLQENKTLKVLVSIS